MPTPVTPNQPLWGTESGTIPLLAQIEARGWFGGVFVLPPVGTSWIFQLAAKSPGGTVVEWVYAATTLPPGADTLPDVLCMVGPRPAPNPGAATFCQIGGAPAVNVVTMSGVAGAAAGLNAGFLFPCPQKETAPLVGPNERYWGTLHSRVFVQPDQFFQIAPPIDQYLQFAVVWRELN